MKKKVLALVLAVAMVVALCVGLVACNDGDDGELKAIAKEDIKIGLICLHPASQSTYDKNFVDAMRQAVADLGLDASTQLVIREGVDENGECYDAAVELAEAGCNIIFADSFGHEDFIIEAAKEFPSVRFCHATGTKAHTLKLENYYNAFASIYEGRYLAGVVAGLELNAMIEAGKFTASEAKIGYVGAHPYAEVKSGYTSFFLGAQSVCPTATMEVSFTGSWFDEDAEKNTAIALINRGCKLISQHADSMGAPTGCNERGVPNVTYNVATKNLNTYLAYSRINWAPYYKYVVNCAINNEKIDWDWVGNLSNGAVEFGEYGTSVTEDMIAKVNTVKAKLISGEIKVFDCSKFTVSGSNVTANMTVDANHHITAYLADVDSDANFTPDTNVVEGGIFKESFFRAAPYFDINIDGITLLN